MGNLYLLICQLEVEREIQVGALGRLRFPAGYYAYVGSAARALQARVARHLSRRKRYHWHIDYLLSHAVVVGVRLWHQADLEECQLNRWVAGQAGLVPVHRGFGSSDCACYSHLSYAVDFPGTLLMGDVRWNTLH